LVKTFRHDFFVIVFILCFWTPIAEKQPKTRQTKKIEEELTPKRKFVSFWKWPSAWTFFKHVLELLLPARYRKHPKSKNAPRGAEEKKRKAT
jgi:hypothetical protein